MSIGQIAFKLKEDEQKNIVSIICRVYDLFHQFAGQPSTHWPLCQIMGKIGGRIHRIYAMHVAEYQFEEFDRIGQFNVRFVPAEIEAKALPLNQQPHIHTYIRHN